MGEFVENKKYESLKIPGRQEIQEIGPSQATPREKDTSVSKEIRVPLANGLFYVIDYNLCPIEGAGKLVLKSQKIEPPEKDDIKDLFASMRNIARENRPLAYDYNRFFDKNVQQVNAIVFYRQGHLMKDFTDNFIEKVPFQAYFPNYQLMSHQQLRTYFTWRTAVRQGHVTETSLSYAFLYMYELINNIGVDGPQDGLDRLMSFWKAFRVFDSTIDKYIIKWLKDYHIYYQLPRSFKEFVDQNNLAGHYLKLADTDDHFDLFCSISKYDIKSSAFFSGEHVQLFTDCFYFVKDKLRQVFMDNGIPFDESIFQPAKKMTAWRPFKDALFHHWLKQPDRRIILSENEIYICSRNNWAFNSVITTESGRQLIGFIMKRIESVLRTATKYKHKLTANIDSVSHPVVGQLSLAGISLEKTITTAVMAFYREATKTVVTVDHERLSRIRQEALATQEKLIVEDADETVSLVSAAWNPAPAPWSALPPPMNLSLATPADMPPLPAMPDESTATADAWDGLRNAFSATELQALSVVMQGSADLKKFADDNHVMLEVLVDGINEKAADFIGDSLLDEEFAIFDDYKAKIKGITG